MAYMIADTGDEQNHNLHKVRDICQDGNIDRVARILGLAYSQVLLVLSPIIRPPHINEHRDTSASPHDYRIDFREGRNMRFAVTPETKLKVKETVHEYMVSMVLADWLAVTLPPAADVWKYRSEQALASLGSIVNESMNCTLRRKIIW